MDTHFHKPAEPWEKTEGYVNTLAMAGIYLGGYLIRTKITCVPF